jgi:uncharacterized protein YndB with AHSA1/START domain
VTEQKSFKRLVRARMEKTGESYTAARAMLLAGRESGAAVEVRLATSDEKIRQRTGRGWEEWFEMLDEWGAADRSHRETARWLAQQQGVDPLAWNVQAVASSYQRARELREPGEKDDGYAITASKTIHVPVHRLFDAVVDASLRVGWLPDGQLSERTATRPKSARFDWSEGRTRVNVTFLNRGENKSTIALEHRRMASTEEAEQMKNYWRARLAALKGELER